MKDSMLINNRLSNRFWAKLLEIANCLQNRLPTRSKNHGKMIPKKAWIGRHLDFYHICIFESLAFYNILEEKRVKSDHQKVWKRILIRYSPYISKHFHIWASHTKQIVIVSKPSIDKSEQGIKLLIKWLLNETPLLRWKVSAKEQK